MVRITSKDAQGMKDAYSKLYAPTEEPTVEAEPTEEPATDPEACTEE